MQYSQENNLVPNEQKPQHILFGLGKNNANIR